LHDALPILEQIREIPGVALSTDIIVGFPGETDADYEATVSLMESVRYDSAFMFAYSERSGTYAAKRLADDVPDTVKKARLARIIELQTQISKEIYATRVGQRYAVLVEGPARKDPTDVVGNTDDFKTTVFAGQGFRAGDVVEVEIEAATSHSLRGRPIRLLQSSRVPVSLMEQLTTGISIGAARRRGSAVE